MTKQRLRFSSLPKPFVFDVCAKGMTSSSFVWFFSPVFDENATESCYSTSVSVLSMFGIGILKEILEVFFGE